MHKLSTWPVCLMASWQKCNSYWCMVTIELLCISSFQHNRSIYSNSQTGEVFGDHDYIMVENTVLVSHDGILTEKFLNTSTIQKLPKHKPSKGNYRCYRRLVESKHLKSIWINSQVMVCLYNFKEHESLYSNSTANNF